MYKKPVASDDYRIDNTPHVARDSNRDVNAPRFVTDSHRQYARLMVANRTLPDCRWYYATLADHSTNSSPPSPDPGKHRRATLHRSDYIRCWWLDCGRSSTRRVCVCVCDAKTDPSIKPKVHQLVDITTTLQLRQHRQFGWHDLHIYTSSILYIRSASNLDYRRAWTPIYLFYSGVLRKLTIKIASSVQWTVHAV